MLRQKTIVCAAAVQLSSDHYNGIAAYCPPDQFNSIKFLSFNQQVSGHTDAEQVYNAIVAAAKAIIYDCHPDLLRIGFLAPQDIVMPVYKLPAQVKLTGRTQTERLPDSMRYLNVRAWERLLNKGRCAHVTPADWPASVTAR